MQIVLPFSEGNENVMKIFKGHHGQMVCMEVKKPKEQSQKTSNKHKT